LGGPSAGGGPWICILQNISEAFWRLTGPGTTRFTTHMHENIHKRRQAHTNTNTQAHTHTQTHTD
jgi:hypothetical protein